MATSSTVLAKQTIRLKWPIIWPLDFAIEADSNKIFYAWKTWITARIIDQQACHVSNTEMDLIDPSY